VHLPLQLELCVHGFVHEVSKRSRHDEVPEIDAAALVDQPL
jgi:hypothetical protein